MPKCHKLKRLRLGEGLDKMRECFKNLYRKSENQLSDISYKLLKDSILFKIAIY